ncbi:hypothetical protein PG996_011126 [Apiospora saccharicola]|uniref:Uncharacterized protein n=1 Tax=Apiospora saccharicola TaxID=335842 RepID=A0ABR1UE70_9PEZI
MKISTVFIALFGAVHTMAHHLSLHEARQFANPNMSAMPPLEGGLERLLKGSLQNCLSRNRARKCDGLAQDIFMERTLKFLSYWETPDYPHDSTNQTEQDLLIRLVEYQDVYQTLVTESKDAKRFPDNIVDLVRSARDRAMEEGALLNANARVLDALDVIYDDICVTTNKAKVPRRVEEITDIVLRGLARNYENTPFDSNPEPCVCAGYFKCGVISQQYWDPPIKDWQCRCSEETACTETDT